MKEKISITLDESVVEGIKTIIDGIYIRNTSQAVEYLLKKTLSGNNKAIFLCGGGNLRRTETGYFRPCTPFLGAPVIVHNIRFLKSNGFSEIVIVAQKKDLEELRVALSKEKLSGIDVEYVEAEGDDQGSMDSLRKATSINGTTLVAFGDIVFFDSNILDLWKTHLLYKGVATLYVQIFIKRIGRAGVVSMEGNRITSFVQRPGDKFSLMHFSAVFIAEPGIMDYAGHSLEYDVFPELAKKRQLIGYLSEKPVHHFHTEKELKELERLYKKTILSKKTTKTFK